jgi:Fe-S-cluster containining protein
MKDCNQCGKCCQIYGDGGLSATQAEIRWWQDNRPEIARFVQAGRIWMEPETGEALTACPWLKPLPNQNKYGCSIYEDRPDDCRQYPVLVSDMIRDGCEMIEAIDLKRPKVAQTKLDQLMIDSRAQQR